MDNNKETFNEAFTRVIAKGGYAHCSLEHGVKTCVHGESPVQHVAPIKVEDLPEELRPTLTLPKVIYL